MNPSGDFQILKVLNPRTTSDLFLIKDLGTSEIIVWRTVLLRNLSKEKKEILCNKIRLRLQQDHPLLVKFLPVIEDEKLKLIYVPMEYFPHGNLSDFLKKLAKSDTTHISEEIVVKLLFQLLVLLKSIQIYDNITLKNIYFDNDFNVKFLNFSPHSTQAIDVKMCDIGNIIKQICSIPIMKKCNHYDYYSSQFLDLIETMFQDSTEMHVNFDKIIQHPVIILNTFKLNCGMNFNNTFEVLDFRLKLEQLRKKEAMLKSKELKIEKKEHSLNAREKKLAINEKTVKDKFTQAELYLKRCKENKLTQIHKYENIESSLSAEYEDLDSSDIVETSKKLNMDKLERPFIRTFSERKVRFKGHSPLREMNFHRTKSCRKSKNKADSKRESTIEREKLTLNSVKTDLFKDISNTEKSLLKPLTNNEDKKRRSVLFGPKSIFVQDENIPEMDCRPISWTEESKKQAFDLLRIMNSTVERKHWVGDVKHTYL